MADVSNRTPAATGASKAAAFADLAEANGWEVKRIRDGDEKRVIATRVNVKNHSELVEVHWVNNSATNDFGTHTFDGVVGKIKNAATGRRILMDTIGDNLTIPPRVAQPRDRSKIPRRPPKEVPLAMDLTVASDKDVLDYVRGKRVFWINHYTEAPEWGDVPLHSLSTKIELSKSEDTLGERILNFCDRHNGGFRAVFVVAIYRVGR